MKLTGAQILIEVLVEEQVECLFGYPGGTVINIYDELYKNSDRLTHFTTCHEQSAAHAADGYARATGKPGVVLATSGPGATNLITGIANAYLDSIPLIAITGNVSHSLIGRDSFQEVDIKGITMPITKHNYMLDDVKNLADVLREAFDIACSGRPGPVLIDIPKDVQQAECEFTPRRKPDHCPACSPSPSSLERAIELIAKAKRPFIYAGGGTNSRRASVELIRLAETIGAPIGASMMGLPTVPNSHPLFVGMTGMHGRYAAGKVMDSADLIIAVGTRFSDRATGNKQAFCEKHMVLHIDIDPSEIGKNIPVTGTVVADVYQTLKALNELPLTKSEPSWLETARELKQSPQNKFAANANGLTPHRVLKTLRKFTQDDTPIATDVGQHQMWVAQYYRFERPRTFITSGGLGAMGFGMGAAIGACIGTNRKKTVLVTSDGSFHMNMNELATAVSNHLPLVVIVLNNQVLGMVRQWQTMFFDKRYSSTTLERATDYCRLAEAFGANGLRISSPDALEPALSEAFALDGPVVVDIAIDRDAMVLPMIPPNGTISDMIIRG